VLVRAGAAVRIGDADLAGEGLVEAVRSLLADPGRRAAMAQASRGLGHPDAADVVADLVLATGRVRATEAVGT
jgi:UDP-N-acetylglucosamine--N-acetylmuramyl-(pentapeptide) pyrophosphoryl-undecaprenol N-acetylglucosamine transferase